MDKGALIDVLEREGRALAAAGARGLDAPVPACAGWSVRDVLSHVGRVYRSVTLHVERRATEVIPASEVPRAPGDDGLVGFVLEGLEMLVPALRALGEEEPVWTWAGPIPGFYFRRMAHETEIHRHDVESAHGQASGFDPDSATDGISELYERVVPFGMARWEKALPSGSMHLHRTDGPGEWMVEVVDGKVVMSEKHAKGDVAVRGSASDLYLLAWNRRSTDGLEVFGDAEVAQSWQALAP